jgi:hypothetical protein
MSAMGYKFVIVIYPSEDKEGGRFTAHCLNMDVIADDNSIEGAVSDLLENIEATLDAAQKYNANPFKDAPKEYWKKLESAKKLPRELTERIIFSANRRLGHKPSNVIDVERNCDLRQVLQMA